MTEGGGRFHGLAVVVRRPLFELFCFCVLLELFGRFGFFGLFELFGLLELFGRFGLFELVGCLVVLGFVVGRFHAVLRPPSSGFLGFACELFALPPPRSSSS